MKKALGILPNFEKGESEEIARKILEWLSLKGIKGVLPPCGWIYMGRSRSDLVLPLDKWKEEVDFAVVLGGDGTLLGAARHLGRRGVPLLGVNLGHFGFLTEVEVDGVPEALEPFIEGHFKRDERIMLSAQVLRRDKVVFEDNALNEACVIKGPYGRIVTLNLQVTGTPVDTYFADGLIVATPTGSTAYSLSCGGPILVPEIDAILVTPICAHTLYSRSIVLKADQWCEVEVLESSQSTMLSLDGQEFFPLQKKDKIVIKKAPYKTVLLRRRDWSFYDVLRRKMKEGQDRV